LSPCPNAICGRRCLLYGVLPHKLFTSNNRCCWLALLECGDLFSTIYLSKFPTNRSKGVKLEDRADHRTRLIMRHCSETYIFSKDLAGNRLLKGVPDSRQVARDIHNQQPTRRFMTLGRYRQWLIPQFTIFEALRRGFRWQRCLTPPPSD
jgi:hypothetical protein